MSGENTTQYITKEKLEELKQELKVLQTEKRQEVREKIEFAKGLGDLSENSEYHEARDEQARLEDRIITIEKTIKNAEIIKSHHSEIAELGATVVVQKKGDTEKRTFEILGPEEADTVAGKISHESPLGQALLGKKKGDTATVETPGGVVEYTVVEIK